MLLLRVALPALVFVAATALIAMPYIERLYGDWFRSDLDLRASLMVDAVGERLDELVAGDDDQAILDAADPVAGALQVLRELEQSQRLEIEYRSRTGRRPRCSRWCAPTRAPGLPRRWRIAEMIVVSNREPYIHNRGRRAASPCACRCRRAAW
jgi:hypothetical protein